MSNLAQFTTQPIVEASKLSVANLLRDGTGTIVTISSGPVTTAANGVGKMISEVLVQSTGTNAAGMVRFFISINAGTNWNLIEEVSVTATTPSGTVQAFAVTVPLLVGMVLTGGNGSTAQCLLGASTNNAETFNIIVTSGTL